jgi:ParB/RepB/Spo0J family partition protein
MKYSEEVLLDKDQIIADPDQPRKVFDEKDIQGLSEDIQANGLKDALDVYYPFTGEGDKYLIADGERRFKAIGLIPDYGQVRCNLYVFKSQMDVDLHRASKHIHSNPWKKWETALFFQRFIETHKLRQQDLARRFHISQKTVSNLYRITKDESVLHALKKEEIKPTQAYILMEIDDAETRENGLSVAIGGTVKDVQDFSNNYYGRGEEETDAQESLSEGAPNELPVDDGEGDSSLTSDEKEHPPSPETTGNIIEDAFAKPEREAQPSSESPLEVGTEPSLDTEPEEDPEPPEEAEKPKDDFPMVSKVLKRYELTKKATEPDPMTFMPKLPNEKQQTMIRETRRTGEHLICYSARLRASTNGETFESAKLVACKPMVKGLTIEDIKESKEVENAISSITEMRTKLDDHLNVLIKRR